jgi:hypothetical protein
MYCSYCGKPNSDDFRFCSYCGKAQLSANEQTLSSQTLEKTEKELPKSLTGITFESIMEEVLEEVQKDPTPKEFLEELHVQLTNVVSDALVEKRISLTESQNALGYIDRNLPNSLNLFKLDMFLAYLPIKWKIFEEISKMYRDALKQDLYPK